MNTNKIIRNLEKDAVYLSIAKTWAMLSRAKRRQVGAIIVKDDRIISDGFNGTPYGYPNDCEDIFGMTKPEVLHAESNAITKLSTSTQSSEGATIYLTLSPCFDCAKLIIQAKIKEVIFMERYSKYKKPIKFLKDNGITVKEYSPKLVNFLLSNLEHKQR